MLLGCTCIFSQVLLKPKKKIRHTQEKNGILGRVL